MFLLWCGAQDFNGLQIQVTTGWLKLRTSYMQMQLLKPLVLKA